MSNNRRKCRGSALLAVLWLSAALSAIAFSMASTVRSETGRVSSSVDGIKAQFLAAGAVERALLYFEWSQRYRNPDGTSSYFANIPRYVLQFPSGQAEIEIQAEASKMNVNTSLPEDLFRLMAALGVAPARARVIVEGILDWRGAAPPEGLTPFDQQYLARTPSFRARHASLEEIEELLLIQGVTPELFYGTYERDSEGVLRLHHGLRDCLSLYGRQTQIDANGAPLEVLEAIGLSPEASAALIRARSVRPFRDGGELVPFGEGQPGFQRLGIARAMLFTVRATARPRRPDGTLSDARRSTAALVKFLDPAGFRDPYHVLRWYGNVWVE